METEDPTVPDPEKTPDRIETPEALSVPLVMPVVPPVWIYWPAVTVKVLPDWMATVPLLVRFVLPT